MNNRGQEILSAVKERIEMLENELAIQLENRSQDGAQRLREQIQELQHKYSDYVIKILVYGQIPEDYREEDYRVPAAPNLDVGTEAGCTVPEPAPCVQVPGDGRPAATDARAESAPQVTTDSAKRVRRRAKRTNSRSLLASVAGKCAADESSASQHKDQTPLSTSSSRESDNTDHLQEGPELQLHEVHRAQEADIGNIEEPTPAERGGTYDQEQERSTECEAKHNPEEDEGKLLVEEGKRHIEEEEEENRGEMDTIDEEEQQRWVAESEGRERRRIQQGKEAEAAAQRRREEEEEEEERLEREAEKERQRQLEEEERQRIERQKAEEQAKREAEERQVRESTQQSHETTQSHQEAGEGSITADTFEPSERRAAKKRKQEVHACTEQPMDVDSSPNGNEPDRNQVRISIEEDRSAEEIRAEKRRDDAEPMAGKGADPFGHIFGRSEAKLSMLLRQKDELQSSIEGTRRKLNDLTTTCVTQERELKQWQSYVQELHQELRHADEQYRQRLAEEKHDTQRQTEAREAGSESTLSELRAQLENIQKEKQSHVAECERLQSELNAQKELLRRNQEHNKEELNKQKTLLNTQHNEELETLQSQFEEILQASEIKIKGLEEERDELVRRLSGVEEELSRLKERMAQEGTARDKERENQVSTLQAEVDSLRQENASLDKSNEQLRTEGEAWRKRVEEEKREKEREWEEFIHQMEAAIKEKETTSKELEKAKEEAMQLKARLEERQEGEASMHDRHQEMQNLKEEKEALEAKLASELRRTETLSTDNEHLAMKADGRHAEILELKAKLGEEEQRLSDLKNQFHAVEAELMRVITEKDECSHRTQAAENALAQAKVDSDATSAVAEELRKENEALQAQLNETRQELETSRNELQRVINEHEAREVSDSSSAHGEEVARLRQLLDEKDQDLADKQISLESLQSRCEGLQQKFDEALETAAQLKAKVADREKSVEELENVAQRRQVELEELQGGMTKLQEEAKQVQKLQRKKDKLETEQVELAQRLESMTAQAEGWNAERENLRQRIAGSDAELEEKAKEVQRLQKENKKSKKKLARHLASENELVEAKQALVKKIASLESRLQEEHTQREQLELRLAAKEEEGPAHQIQEEKDLDELASSPKRKRTTSAVDETQPPAQDTKRNTSAKRRKSQDTEEKAEVTDVSSAAQQSRLPASPAKARPPSKLSTRAARAKTKVVYFSGFSDNHKQYSVEYKNELAKMVTDLGGEVRFDNEFNEHITHVVRPVGSRTMKTLAAALAQRWLVSPDWIIECGKKNEFVPEEKAEERPFHSKRFCFDDSFMRDNKTKAYKFANAKTLIQLGMGAVVEATEDHIDYTLVGSKYEAAKIQGQPLTWTQFIALIPGSKEDGALDSTIGNASIMHAAASPKGLTVGKGKRKRGAAALRNREGTEKEEDSDGEKENQEEAENVDEDENGSQKKRKASDKRKRATAKKQQRTAARKEEATYTEEGADDPLLQQDSESQSKDGSQEQEEPSTPRRLARRKARRTTTRGAH